MRMETQIFKNILKSELDQINVCPRCTLRFLSVKNYTSYTCNENIQKAFNDTLLHSNDPGNGEVSQNADNGSEHATKKMRLSICPICLGVLQDCDKMIDRVVTEIKNSGYEYTTFSIQLSLPVAIDLREELMLLYIKEKLEGAEDHLDRQNIPSVKDAWKWVVGSGIGDRLNVPFSPDSDFRIIVDILYPDLMKECSGLVDACPSAFPNIKKRKATIETICNRSSVIRAIETLTLKLKDLFSLPPDSPCSQYTCNTIVCTHTPLYLAGRYNKYSRELSQTPWLVDGIRKMESSVQEHITDITQKWVRSKKITFSASGREDVDVKMLGNGRPFVLECLDPHRVEFSSETMRNIQNEINNSNKDISVSLLQIISKAEIKHLKEGEEQKRKTYSALCIVKKELTPTDLETLIKIRDLTLNQKTPIRVLHRRPLATRNRIVHKISGEILGPNTMKIRLETQAGTYVKEFVHGDFGRTTPNLSSILGTEADILELDVESIHLDWPPMPPD